MSNDSYSHRRSPIFEPKAWDCEHCNATGWTCAPDAACREVMPKSGVRVVSLLCEEEHRCEWCGGKGEVYESTTKEYDG